MSKPNLIALVNSAFESGQQKKGLELLRRYNQENAGDGAGWHRRAVIEEQIGTASEAGKAHFSCIQAAPNNALGYLYAGSWLEDQNLPEAAAALYSLAQDLDVSIVNLEHNHRVSSQLRKRSRRANQLIRQFLTMHHKDALEHWNGGDRIRNALWVRTHDQPIGYGIDNFNPELFFIPDLETIPFHNPEKFEWASLISEQANTIKRELAVAMAQPLSHDSIRPYLGDDFSHQEGVGHLANSTDWLAMDIYKDGELNENVAQFFPVTVATLNSLPLYSLKSKPYEVFFSFLKPYQNIGGHFGQSNHALTVHLGIDVPTESHLVVAEEERVWQEGELIVFDDSFFHSAHNKSNQTRVVLIFSIWHPELSAQERRAVQQSFASRQNWMLNRQSHIGALLGT